MTEQDVCQLIADALRDAGIAALISPARISAVFPNGQKIYFQDLHIDTRNEDGVAVTFALH
jgi:hypothetical protein